MSLPDATAGAALGGQVIKPVHFIYVNINGDPVRCNTSGADVYVDGTGDEDLDGFTFVGVASKFIDVSPVKNKQGGSDPVTATLSGLPEIDADTLALIGDPANWQTKDVRIWRIVRDAANTQQGAFQEIHTGYMVALDIGGDETQQIISIVAESYLASLSQASGRTYLMQEVYDSGDQSAKAAIAIANGVSGIVGNTPAGRNFYGPGVRIEPRTNNPQL